MELIMRIKRTSKPMLMSGWCLNKTYCFSCLSQKCWMQCDVTVELGLFCNLSSIVDHWLLHGSPSVTKWKTRRHFPLHSPPHPRPSHTHPSLTTSKEESILNILLPKHEVGTWCLHSPSRENKLVSCSSLPSNFVAVNVDSTECYWIESSTNNKLLAYSYLPLLYILKHLLSLRKT